MASAWGAPVPALTALARRLTTVRPAETVSTVTVRASPGLWQSA